MGTHPAAPVIHPQCAVIPAWPVTAITRAVNLVKRTDGKVMMISPCDPRMDLLFFSHKVISFPYNGVMDISLWSP